MVQKPYSEQHNRTPRHWTQERTKSHNSEWGERAESGKRNRMQWNILWNGIMETGQEIEPSRGKGKKAKRIVEKRTVPDTLLEHCISCTFTVTKELDKLGLCGLYARKVYTVIPSQGTFIHIHGTLRQCHLTLPKQL